MVTVAAQYIFMRLPTFGTYFASHKKEDILNNRFGLQYRAGGKLLGLLSVCSHSKTEVFKL